MSSAFLISLLIPRSLDLQRNLNLNLNQNQWWCRRFLSSSVIPFLFLILAAFAETLEAVDRGGQEEARHDGRHRHGDAGEDDDEVIREGQVAAALSETFLRE